MDFLHFSRDNRTSLTYDLIEDFRQQIVDTVINLINKKQTTVDDLDKRNNSIKLNKRKVIASKILDKINSTITYNGEELTYKDIINRKSSNLAKTILDEEEFIGFLSIEEYIYIKNHQKILVLKIYTQTRTITKYSYNILRTTPIF